MINHLAEQRNNAMYLLYKRINNLNIPIDLQLMLFDNTTVPILTYSCEVWGFKNNLNPLESIHLAFLRKITKARKSTPAYTLYGELGRHPLRVTIDTHVAEWLHTGINLFTKTQTNIPHLYTKQCFKITFKIIISNTTRSSISIYILKRKSLVSIYVCLAN